ncbi:AAA family ATPase [Agathobaculum sp.]|uniref:AAA family ATPase n=1 Tax=Agathobaculum sp. TaxID=2048138 RepID=UPI003FA47198
MRREIYMRITSIHIQNFRKLLQCHIDFSKETTLFVGANNSGMRPVTRYPEDCNTSQSLRSPPSIAFFGNLLKAIRPI